MASLVTRQFDVCRYPGHSTETDAPYVCVIQSHYLAGMDTVIVAPLLRTDMAATNSQVTVPVSVDGENYALDLALMANIETRHLGVVVGNLLDHEFEIRRALDRLFTGF